MTEKNYTHHAEWSYSAVLYEMNIRQLTPEGTLRAAEKKLEFLREMGIDAIWMMPIYPIGEEGRKGSLGSYYSIRDYKAINPEFGTMEDFDSFVAKAHSLGMKVLLDWVANHSARDAKWLHLYRKAFTFVLVCFAWIFFRANSTSDALLLVKKLFTDWSISDAYINTTIDHLGLTLIAVLISILSIYIMNRMDINQLKLGTDADGAIPVFRYAYIIWIIAIAWLLLLVGDGASSFIYFQF